MEPVEQQTNDEEGNVVRNSGVINFEGLVIEVRYGVVI